MNTKGIFRSRHKKMSRLKYQIDVFGDIFAVQSLLITKLIMWRHFCEEKKLYDQTIYQCI